MPLTIHHSTVKKAEKEGVVLTVEGQLARAFIPQTATLAFGASGADALKQIAAAKEIREFNSDYRFKNVDDPKIHGYIFNFLNGDRSNQQSTPVALLDMLKDGGITWQSGDEVGSTSSEPQETGESVDDITDTLEPESGEPADDPADPEQAGQDGGDFAEDAYPKDPPVVATPPVKRAENGVALDGAIAYREGTPSADCPYSSEGDDEEYALFEAWNDAWDAAADAKTEEDEAEGKGGSVVKSKYRTKYKEEGHPNHCGDWLAELLNNYCVGDKNTDLETFERICKLNGVDTSKYKRDGVGWQGRIRMTGRNLLAKVVFKAGHIFVPNDEPDATDDRRMIEAPADWIAAQRYNKPDQK